MKYLTAAALVMAVTIQLPAQSPASQSADDGRFEVVSIKPSGPSRTPACQPPTCYSSFVVPQPGRFRGSRMSVLGLVGFAYSTPASRIVGPDWTKSEQFDIEASHNLPGSGQTGWQPMLQRLLEDRFSLKMHREQRRSPVYVLTRSRDDGRLGPQLAGVTGGNDRPGFLPSSYAKSCGAIGAPSATSRVGLATWENLNLYRQIEQTVDRPVVDETGLSGWFALFLEWSDDPAQTEKASIFTALREQLGLKLEATERPLEVIVVDSAERPAPN